MLPDAGPGPFIETDSHGYSTAASASDEAGLSVMSAQIQEATAESLDDSSTTVKNPGNLADLRDEAYLSGKPPAGSTDADKHSAWGRVFALKAVGGWRPRVLRPHGATHPGTAARPDLRGRHPGLLLLQPDPDIGHHRLHRAARHVYPAGPSEPTGPRLRHYRTRVSDRLRIAP